MWCWRCFGVQIPGRAIGIKTAEIMVTRGVVLFFGRVTRQQRWRGKVGGGRGRGGDSNKSDNHDEAIRRFKSRI